VACFHKRLTNFLGFTTCFLEFILFIARKVLECLAPQKESLVIVFHAFMKLMPDMNVHSATIEAGVEVGELVPVPPSVLEVLTDGGLQIC